MGIALSTAEYEQPEEVIRDADIALYRAKALGRARYIVFDHDMHVRAVELLQTEMDLRRAIDRQEFVVYYQPIVSLKTHRITGFEALVRWQHPERGWIQPADFIGIAEESGLIADLGDFVLREACLQVRRWDSRMSLHPDFQLHVNVSPRQLRSDHLIDEVRRVLADTKLTPRRLVIEMTESFVGEHGVVARERMRQLKSVGIGLAIDDFGTGYSSLAILQDMPFDILKVDRAFIDDVDDDPRSRAFTAAIFALGKTLGLRMVAEGVEREKQRVALMALGCSLAQGFLFSPAVDDSAISAMLSDHGSAAIVPLRVMSRVTPGSETSLPA